MGLDLLKFFTNLSVHQGAVQFRIVSNDHVIFQKTTLYHLGIIHHHCGTCYRRAYSKYGSQWDFEPHPTVKCHCIFFCTRCPQRGTVAGRSGPGLPEPECAKAIHWTVEPTGAISWAQNSRGKFWKYSQNSWSTQGWYNRSGFISSAEKKGKKQQGNFSDYA